ncbi:hypothetical protein V4C53_35665 [Paraburkholderia azotifigens]|uniref:hypothetical protein n=1 Tax=Paraburkholderia azotifigens TaxID=2057004 RepID=UPI00316F0D33
MLQAIGLQKAATFHVMTNIEKYSNGEIMTLDESEQIEELLSIWYRWQIRESNTEVFSHWYRATDHTCRGYVTPTREEEDDEAAQNGADDMQSEQVQLCIDLLPAEYRASISVSMLNKDAGHTVWSSGRAGDQHATYQAAKLRLLPMFVSRGLVRRTLDESTSVLVPPRAITAAEIEEMRALFSQSYSGGRKLL